MAINLATKFAPNALKAFTIESVAAGRSCKEYEFDGAKSLKVFTNQTVPLTDYNRTAAGNRYGTPTEISDTVQTLTVTQDKSFAGTIDRGNAQDQMNIKKAGAWLRQEMDEVVTPTIDQYCIRKWVRDAGKVAGIAAPDSDFDSGGILFQIAAAVTYLNNRKVPKKARTLYISETNYNLILNTKEFIGVEKLGERAFDKHSCGTIYGLDVVSIPDDYFPDANCYFLIVYKNSVLAPFKLRETKLHDSPPGLNGDLIEGRFYYDAFVLETRADGVYAAVSGTYKLDAPTIAEDASVDGKVTIVCENADRIMYTLDGTDPRYSETAQVYGAAFTLAESATVRAVGYDDTAKVYYPSDVAAEAVAVGS